LQFALRDFKEVIFFTLALVNNESNLHVPETNVTKDFSCFLNPTFASLELFWITETQYLISFSPVNFVVFRNFLLQLSKARTKKFDQMSNANLLYPFSSSKRAGKARPKQLFWFIMLSMSIECCNFFQHFMGMLSIKLLATWVTRAFLFILCANFARKIELRGH
jgi:hypothetical protein